MAIEVGEYVWSGWAILLPVLAGISVPGIFMVLVSDLGAIGRDGVVALGRIALSGVAFTLLWWWTLSVGQG